MAFGSLVVEVLPLAARIGLLLRIAFARILLLLLLLLLLRLALTGLLILLLVALLIALLLSRLPLARLLVLLLLTRLLVLGILRIVRHDFTYLCEDEMSLIDPFQLNRVNPPATKRRWF
jgi:hypothetical protein